MSNRTLWLVELEDYDSYVQGVYSSKEIAVEGLKADFPIPPNQVCWSEIRQNQFVKNSFFIEGSFEHVTGFSTKHIARFRICPIVLDAHLK